MKRIRTFAFAAAALLVAASAMAQRAWPESVKPRLERIAHRGGMMENCRGMMKDGGTMGGMMGGGRPNEQWRKGEAGK